MLDEHVELFEGALVEKQLDALARRQLATLVLCLDTCLSAAQAGVLAPLLEFVEDVFHGVEPFPVHSGRRCIPHHSRRPGGS